MTGVGGLLIGGLQEVARPSERRPAARSQFVVVPAAAGLAIGGELLPATSGAPRRPARRRERALAREVARNEPRRRRRYDHRVSAGERKLADRIARRASRVLPGNESLWRPVGHVISLAAITAGTRVAMRTRLRHDRNPRRVGRTVLRSAAAVVHLSGSHRQRRSVRDVVEAGPPLRLERAGRRNDLRQSWAKTRST